MSTGTLPPWLAPWSGSGLVFGQRVHTPGAAERRRVLEHRHRPRLTIYTYGHDALKLRFSSWSEGGSGAGDASSGGAGDTAGAVSVPPPPAGPPVRWERVPLDHEPWHVDVPVPVQPRALDRPPRYDLTIHSDEAYAPPAPAPDALHAWGGVLRGWAAGATLLALLVIIARLAERFLDWKYLLRRRRMHREWQRANVRATCRLEGEPLPAELSDVCCSVDLPPPYSACTLPAADNVPKNDDRIEEPPPPYSDSCVQFINKNGIPVIVYSRDPNKPDEEGQRQVERFLQACGINMTSAVTQTISAEPETNRIVVDENIGMITCLETTATGSLEAINNLNGGADPLSDIENITNVATNNTDRNDTYVAPNDTNVAPNDTDSAPNDPGGAPIDTHVASIVSKNLPNDGSVIV